MNDKQFGAFWDDEENKIYGVLIDRDKNLNLYRHESGVYYEHFHPCERPVPWPPEPVKKKMVAYVKDDAKFQEWGMNIHGSGKILCTDPIYDWLGWKEEE